MEDFEAGALMEADERVKANTGSVQDRRESWNQLLSISGHWSLMGWGALCAVVRSSGRFIGRFGPSKPFGWPAIEIGWMLLPEFQGQGYALEGAAAAMDFAFFELNEPRVIHTIRPANIASQKLAQKLGSKTARSNSRRRSKTRPTTNGRKPGRNGRTIEHGWRTPSAAKTTLACILPPNVYK
jgi:RimJ/RimL family protein N-acetyltransferase